MKANHHFLELYFYQQDVEQLVFVSEVLLSIVTEYKEFVD